MGKRELLQELIERFEINKFTRFLSAANSAFKPVTEDYSHYLDTEGYFSDFTKAGQIEFKDGGQLLICTIFCDKPLTERTGKKKQYDLAKKVLKDTYCEAGLFLYDDNSGRFRLSFICARYMGPKRLFSTYRRYTYFVSKELFNKTFINQVGRCDFSSVDIILDAFSIEAVNKEFYTEIAKLFTKLTGGWRKIGSKTQEEKGCMKLPGIKEDTKADMIKKEFAVRLIGRLIFCWFLKKKTSKANISLIPEEILSTKAMEKITGVGGYYHSVLEPLFFELLNTPGDKRKKTLTKEPWLQIPFLNGGLFTPHEHDFYELTLDSYSKHINTLEIPDNWIKELLEIFERYNFTIDENTPIDVELSIEPEMLGRIFENLLAEINPETGETARKAFGSYYTPRAIVEYMVDASLKQYLLTKTAINEKTIAELLSYSNEDGQNLTEDETEKMIQALHEVRIIDPACGSGAFPIGILQKILLVLQKLDPDSQKWLAKMLDNVPDKLVRKELKKKIKVPNYLHKLGIIRDCIFGVDILPISVEISKLRCFLSLIVDEDVDDKEENRGIQPLPNLEFKFVCANTLISPDLYHKNNLNGLGFKDVFFEQLEEYAKDYFTAENNEEKNHLKNKIENLIHEKTKEKLNEIEKLSKHYDERFSDLVREKNIKAIKHKTQEMELWNSYINIFKNEPVKFFDTKYFFPGIKDGFSIVIANPPWVSLMGKHSLEINKKNAVLLKNIFPGNTYMPNLYEYFIQVGLLLLRKGGLLTFIVPDRFGYNESCAYLRRSILKQYKLEDVVYRWKFEKIIADTMTIIVRNRENDSYEIRIKHRPELEFIPVNSETLLRESKHIIRSYENKQVKSLVDKIKESSQPLIKYAKSTSGFGGKSNLITNTRINKRQIPVIKGSSIAPYHIRNRFYFEFKDGNITGRTRDRKKLGIKGKILLRKTGDNLIAAYDADGIFPEQSAYFIYDIEEDMIGSKYLLALINSKLMTWFYINHLVTNLDSTPQLKNYDLDALPILIPNEGQDSEICVQVNEIEESIGRNDKRKFMRCRDQIDKIVYQLYGMTEDEITIVENSIK